MLLQNLRTQTAPFHSSLEQNPVSLRLMSETVTLTDYKVYLRGLYGYLKNYESLMLSRLEAINKPVNKYRKMLLIESDLLMLDYEPDQIPVIEQEQLMTIYPSLESTLGGLYVLEGSMLGGVVIRKHLQKCLGIEVEGKLQYLGAYGDVPALRWKDFLVFFCAAAGHLEENEVINGAIGTFQSIDKWLRTTIND